jgi:hypothetical protein
MKAANRKSIGPSTGRENKSFIDFKDLPIVLFSGFRTEKICREQRFFFRLH